jgi:hypothetical protein
MNDEKNKKIEINIDLLLKELGLDSLPETEKSQIAELLHKTIDAKMKLYLMEQVSDDEIGMLNKMSDDDVLNFFTEQKGINFDQLIITIAQECREEFLQDVAYIRGQIAATKKEQE